MLDHTLLARQLDARNPGNGYGTAVANTWYWYEYWLDKVIEKLAEGRARRDIWGARISGNDPVEQCEPASSGGRFVQGKGARPLLRSIRRC